MSIKEKNSVGKRRKVEGKTSALTRRRSPTTFPRRADQDGLAGHGDFFMTGALPLPAASDNIRIRIGSDALTTAASTQPNNYSQSQTNSDCMLFDEEGEDAAGRLQSEGPHSTTPFGHATAGNLGSAVDHHARSDKDQSPQRFHPVHHDKPLRPGTYAGEHVQHAAAKSNTLDSSMQQSEATDPSYYLAHHVRGVERPLKLAFGRSSLLRVSHTTSLTDKNGELQLDHANFDAEEAEIGHAPRNFGEAHQTVIRKHPNPHTIVDDELLRPYLGSDMSSSGHVCVEDGTGTSVPQPHVSARNKRADRTSWPQHTTQGNLTHVNLWTVPASLPVPERSNVRLPDARPLLRTKAVKENNEHESFWRSFVLGSDPQSAIDTIHTHNETSEDSMSRATKGYASTRLPLSNSVTSVSSTPSRSTPFRSLSGQAPRISDDVQYAPHSGSRSITSAAPSHAVWGRIESPDEEDVLGGGPGEETPARSRFGELSTHASLQNHASHDSEMFSDARAPRSDLDRCSRVWDDVSRKAQASGSVVWPRSRGSSICDIPSSDTAGIDLVDADRLT